MATTSSKVKQHAQFSPSKAHRLVPCPGSLAFCEDYPDKESADAQLGTRAHEAAERLLRGAKYDAVFISEYGVDISQAVITYYDAMMTRHGDLLVEIELPLEGITDEEDAVGTSDAVVLGDGYIEVHDYKHGVGVKVFADDNPQTQMYGLGALDKYAAFGPFDEVRMFIHQPRLGHLDYAVMSVEALEEKRVVFREAAHVARSLMRANFKGDEIERQRLIAQHMQPGEKQCKFCPGKAACPAFERYVREAVTMKFDDLTEERIAQSVAVQTVGKHEERIADLYRHLGMIEMWVEAVKGEARLLASEGRLPGWKFVEHRAGDRVWSSEEEAVQVLKSMRLRDDQMYSQKLITPAACEKLLKKTPKRWVRMQQLITRGAPAKSLVRDSDPRPAIVATADKFDDESEGGLV